MTEEVADNKYTELARRAHIFLENLGGRATEAALVKGVFGVNGKVEIWGGILRQVLVDQERFQRLPTGDWVLRNHIEASQPLQRLDYVVIDTETTGLNPGRARMIEIAAIRLRNGQMVDTFQTLINPHRRIPDFITKMTGISPEMTARAPGFGKVADKLVEFIGSSIIVGHNVLFDTRFLNYELSLLYKPAMVNETIDTIGLAVRLYPGLRRPNLDRLASMLGITTQNRHRAFGDASVTAEAFIRLLETAGQHGFVTLEDLRNGRVKQNTLPDIPVGTTVRTVAPEPSSLFSSDLPEERPERISTVRRRSLFVQEEIPGLTNRATAHARDILSRDHLRNLPPRPGVYLMKDSTGKIIYVGKAKNLRERVSSYYSEPLGYTRKIDGLIEAIAAIDHIETGSELEALLLESRLIKKYLPRYNSQLRNYEAYPFIKINITQRFPRVQSSREVVDDGSLYFGPFRNRKAVDTTIDVIEQMFPIRNCTRSFEPETLEKQKKGRPPCLRLYTNRCPGPCAGNHADEQHAGYMKVIDEVINFISGEKEAILDDIWKRINRAVGERDFEKAAQLRNALAQVQQVIATQQYLARAVEGNHFLICLPSIERGMVEVLCILAGRLGRQLRVSLKDKPHESARLLKTAWDELLEQEARLNATLPGWGKKGGRVIGQGAVDEINIISRWIFAHSDDPGIFTIPHPINEADFWLNTVEQVARLSFHL